MAAGRIGPDRIPHQQPRAVDVGRRIGQRMGDALEGADLLAELDPFVRIGCGNLEGAAGDPGEQRRRQQLPLLDRDGMRAARRVAAGEHKPFARIAS